MVSPRDVSLHGSIRNRMIIPVSVNKHSFYTSLGHAKQQHQLLSSPRFGVFEANVPKGLLLWRSDFSQTPVVLYCCCCIQCAVGRRTPSSYMTIIIMIIIMIIIIMIIIHMYIYIYIYIICRRAKTPCKNNIYIYITP